MTDDQKMAEFRKAVERLSHELLDAMAKFSKQCRQLYPLFATLANAAMACPSCGSTSRVVNSGIVTAIECSCGLRSPWCGSESQAWNEWRNIKMVGIHHERAEGQEDE